MLSRVWEINTGNAHPGMVIKTYIGPQYTQTLGMHMLNGSRMHAGGQRRSTGKVSQIMLHLKTLTLHFRKMLKFFRVRFRP